MAHKLALVLAVLALSSIANAALTTSSWTTASFNVTPVVVVNSSDTVFYNKLTTANTQFGAGSDNTTNYMYGWVAPASGFTYTINRRKLNATTQASLGDESLSVPCGKADIKTFTGGQGTFAATCSAAAGGTTFSNLHLYTFTAASTTAKDTTLTAETADANLFSVKSVWYDDGAMIWYVVFIKQTASNDLGLYIQAVNVSNGTNTLLYTTSGGVAVFTPATATSIANDGITDISASPNNVTNATTASVTYKDSTTANGALLKLVPVTLATGAPGSAVTLGTDASTSSAAAGTDTVATPAIPGHTVVNAAVGLGCSYSTYLAGVLQTETNTATTASATETTTRKVFIFYNGSSTSTENYTVASTVDGGIGIAGTQYGGGYTIFQSLTTGVNQLVQYINYFGNGSYNTSSTPTSVGTFQGTVDMWLDANGALWVGAANGDPTATSPLSADLVLEASVGKLFGQVYLFANTLSSVFAFVALMVAALFAF